MALINMRRPQIAGTQSAKNIAYEREMALWDAKRAKKKSDNKARKEAEKQTERDRKRTVEQEAITKTESSIPVLKSFSKNLNPSKVIGLPPSYVIGDTDLSDHKLILASMPIMAIYPAYPSLGGGEDKRAGLQTFNLDHAEGRKKYKMILDSAFDESIYTTNEHCIYVAFTNDASLSESFNSEFGESKFEQLGNMASSSAEELRYMTGQASMGKAIESMKKNMGGILGGLTGAAGGLVGLGEKVLEGVSGGSGLSKVLSGSKIDFPQMWKGSAYSPSYSISIRLYNYNPKDLALHKQFIVEPLAKLLAFTIPLSDSASTFTYPVLCSVSCPGLFMLKAAYVSSIEVIKGGDANNISFIQRPGIVDVKMTFNTLYGSLIAEDTSLEPGNSVKDRFRPIFKEYINNLNSYADLPAGPGTVIESSLEEVQEIGRKGVGPEKEDPNEPVSRVFNGHATIYDTVKPS